MPNTLDGPQELGAAMREDLINPELFGNDAGEDEEPEILSSYFLEKPEHAPFFREDRRLGFVRSRKGCGKSAMLREVMYRRNKMGLGELLLYVKASDLVALQDVDSSSPGALIHGWQQRICSLINLELGSVLRVGFDDDSMSLIEQAELAGFRGRNLVGSLIDRMRASIKDFEISRERVQMGDSQALLKRVVSNDIRAWVFIDDVDATFLNTPEERLRVSTFFSACRNLCNSVAGLNLRASVRTDVWSIVCQHDEALDKCEQYMMDIKWSFDDSAKILENKIRSYFERTRPPEETERLLAGVRRTSNLVFREPWPWGKKSVAAVSPIHTLSAGRPRWANQLCRLAGKEAYRKSSALITFGDVKDILRQYGQSRLSDLYKEHRHQCPQMERLIESFTGGHRRYTTEELLEHIRQRIIIKYGMPTIDGASAGTGATAVAHFLYRIGFLAARNENDDKGLGFVNFEDRPSLLTTLENLDDGMDWEVHPSYRAVLRIK